MTDLEMTRLCAEAMGYTGFRWHADCDPGYECGSVKEIPAPYKPLHDDAQAMALVKEFQLCVQPPGCSESEAWHAWYYDKPNFTGVADSLNRAIVECVARMQQAKAA